MYAARKIYYSYQGLKPKPMHSGNMAVVSIIFEQASYCIPFCVLLANMTAMLRPIMHQANVG